MHRQSDQTDPNQGRQAVRVMSRSGRCSTQGAAEAALAMKLPNQVLGKLSEDHKGPLMRTRSPCGHPSEGQRRVAFERSLEYKQHILREALPRPAVVGQL